MKKEIWKDVKGYEGIYQVSSGGRVKSLKYNKERMLKTSLDREGYYCCSLYFNGNKKTFKVHKLVAIAFLNHSPNGHNEVVDHINADKTDNRLSNLQLISHRENSSKDRKGGSSEYVGVTWHKRANKWVSHIRINSERKYLGLFTKEIEAAQAYQNALNQI